jgi:caa(3)-type oxidase subunit IV
MSEEAHAHTNYVKIWAILVVLLVISVIGPMFEIQALTLITAFGIAVVKALMVAKKFMHIDDAPKFITYLMVTCLVFMLLFFAAVAPDVLKSDGDNWVKTASWQYTPPDPGHGSSEDH